MHPSTLFVVLAACGALAAPVEQQPLAGKGKGPLRVEKKTPYTPDHRDPYDKKVDSIGDKLDPLPWVSSVPRSEQVPAKRAKAKWGRRKHARPTEQSAATTEPGLDSTAQHRPW